MFSLEGKRQPRLSFAGLFVLALAFSCAAQTSRVAGAIQGSVVDQTGGGVAGAIATLRNLGTNQARSISTNAEGFFRAGELPVGQYELRVESSGFSPYVNNTIVVSGSLPQRCSNRSRFRSNRRRLIPRRLRRPRLSATTELRSHLWLAATTLISCFWPPS